MKKRNSVTARILAALALIAVIFAVVSIVSNGLKDDNSSKKNSANHHTKQHRAKHVTKAKSYEVQTGDTLISIAHRTGIPVATILALNPEVDPQILIAGEVLKLRE
jgi:LysM repeat protein